MDSSLKNEIDTENGSYSQNHHQDFVNHEIHQNNLTTITKVICHYKLIIVYT